MNPRNAQKTAVRAHCCAPLHQPSPSLSPTACNISALYLIKLKKGFAKTAAILEENNVSLKFWSNENHPDFISRSTRENYWFHSANLETMAFNAPLEGQVSADIAIIGGGFTGLACAYHLASNNPDKKIVLLEAAWCGSGASGRSGGFADTGVRFLSEICEAEGPEKAREIYDVTLEGFESIRHLTTAHGVDCDFAANGAIELANFPYLLEDLEEERNLHEKLGLEARLLDKAELQRRIKSDRYVGGLWYPYGGTVNPFKLSRGMKRVVEEKGVQVFEKSPAMWIRYGKRPVVVTEFGQVNTQTLVIATDGYSPAFGLFRRQVLPMCAYVIATAPLSDKQLESIGWAGREKLSDVKPVFDYFHLNHENRIIFGGAGLRYLLGGRICTRPHQPTIASIRKSLFQTFPQLEGLEVTHRWGGTLGMTYDFLPSVGFLGEEGNVLYALGYSGEGTILTQVAGKIINHLYRKEENRLTRLFFVRKPIPRVPPEPFIFLGFHAFRFYYKHLTRRSVR